MSYKLGFFKMRFSVEEGSKKEKIIKGIIKIEDGIKRFLAKLLLGELLKFKGRKHSVCINDQKLIFYDLMFSEAFKWIAEDIEKDCYGFKNIDFKEGDIVIDIGANIGIVSVYLAKKYPFLKIYSFEPFPANYRLLLKNIKINNIPDGIIHPFNEAITKDGRNIVMSASNYLNSGSFSINFKEHNLEGNNIVHSATLDSIIETVLAENKQEHIRLLKMDCELSEYEILKNTKIENLRKISFLSGEFHEKKGFDNPDELESYVKKYIPNVNIVKCKLD